MFAAKVNVERDKLPDKMRFRGAFPQILYRADGGRIIRPRGVQGDAQRRHPTLQQRNQIVEERVVGVRRISDGLEASQRPVARPHVILEHPEVAALHRLRKVFAVEALDQSPKRRRRVSNLSLTSSVHKSLSLNPILHSQIAEEGIG